MIKFVRVKPMTLQATASEYHIKNMAEIETEIVEWEYLDYIVSHDPFADTQTHTLKYKINGQESGTTMMFKVEFLFDIAQPSALSLLCESAANHMGAKSLATELQNVVQKSIGMTLPIQPVNDIVIKSSQNDISEISKKLPGASDRVDYPPECMCPVSESSGKKTVWYVVQHLNDAHKWSREKIADWLDELHDAGKINIEFSPWDEEPVEENKTLGTSYKSSMSFTLEGVDDETFQLLTGMTKEELKEKNNDN